MAEKRDKEQEKKDEEVLEDDDEPISPEELDERRQFRVEVLENLSVIKHKEVEISSTAFPGQKRKYYVEDIEVVSIAGKRGAISAIRLVNKNEIEIHQPTLKFPTDTIKFRKDGAFITYTLTYSYEPNVRKSFRHFYKKNRPDMVIYIRFPE